MHSRRVALLFLGDPKLDRRVHSFAHMFRKIGFAPTIYFSIPGQLATEVTEGYVQLSSRHSSGPRMFLGHHMALRSSLSEIAQADVIVACDLYSLRAAALAKAKSSRSILIYDARELYTGLPSVASRPFVQMAWKKCERDGMMDTDLIVITAPHDADAIFRVHSFLPRPLLLRNIPLRPQSLKPDHNFLSSLSIATSDKVIAYVGGLQQDRGLVESIRAMSEVPPEIKLLLLGSGALRSSLHELAQQHGVQDRVVFAGAVQQERVLSILAACTAGISLIDPRSPSYALALPSKIFEYLHAGLPVISTELKHVTELFDHQPYMHYVNSMNAAEISSAITQAVDSKQNLRDVIAHAASQYSFESDFEKLASLVEERLAERE